MIRPATIEDAAALSAIYNPYIAETTITFEEQLVSPDEMSARIAEVTASLPWLVLEIDGRIAGYAYATKFRARAAYRHTVESTIYLAPAAQGRGLGRQLYAELLRQLRELRLHRVIGAIALPNVASVALHEKLGFRRAGHFSEVGRKFDRWIDVGYWQLDL